MRKSEPEKQVPLTQRACTEGAETVVVVGYTQFLMNLLSGLLPSRSVVVLEEPQVIERRSLDEATERHPCLRAVLPAHYQSEDWLRRSTEPKRIEGTVAVLPGSEYAVQAAADLARLWGLPGAGSRAAYTMRNKDVLRSRADGHLRQPDWACPATEQELLEFAQQRGGAVVLKPSNGQASAGVTRCTSVDDVMQYRDTFDDFTGDPLRAPSMSRPRLMVEQCLSGPEYSVECLVTGGSIVFMNVTTKTVASGKHPVELGHTVPSNLGPIVERRLRSDVARMVRMIRVGTAVLHSEWIIHEGAPHLIECAGRLPGDNITALISRAWGFDFVGAWVELMSGRLPRLPSEPQHASAIWFLAPPEPGTLRAVTGIAEAAGLPGTVEVEVGASSGDILAGLSSSWSRIGHVVATGDSAPEALRTAQCAAGLIEIDVV
jgi:biotin carboxylase